MAAADGELSAAGSSMNVWTTREYLPEPRGATINQRPLGFGAGLMCAGGGCGTSGVVTARSWAWLSLIPLTCVKAGPVAIWHLLAINRHEGGNATNNNTTLNPHYVLLSM